MKFIELLEQISSLSEELGEYEDVTLKLDTLEGETDYKKWMVWIFNRICEEQAREQSQADRIKTLSERKKATGNRIDKLRDMMQAILSATGEDTLSLDEFTVSMRKVAPKAIIMDETAIPDAYMVVKKSPDKKAINEAVKNGEVINGVQLDNGCVSLTIRRL